MNWPEVNWTQIGREHTATDDQRARVQREIDRMDWQTLPARLPMSQGMAIQRATQEYGPAGIGRVSINAGIGPMALLGIEKCYVNGLARIYLLDDGTDVTPLRSDFWPKQSAGIATPTMETAGA